MNTDPRRAHWNALTREQQLQAIRRMASEGSTEGVISHATGLSREYVQRVLGDRQEQCA